MLDSAKEASIIMSLWTELKPPGLRVHETRDCVAACYCRTVFGIACDLKLQNQDSYTHHAIRCTLNTLLDTRDWVSLVARILYSTKMRWMWDSISETNRTDSRACWVYRNSSEPVSTPLIVATNQSRKGDSWHFAFFKSLQTSIPSLDACCS